MPRLLMFPLYLATVFAIINTPLSSTETTPTADLTIPSFTLITEGSDERTLSSPPSIEDSDSTPVISLQSSVVSASESSIPPTSSVEDSPSSSPDIPRSTTLESSEASTPSTEEYSSSTTLSETISTTTTMPYTTTTVSTTSELPATTTLRRGSCYVSRDCGQFEMCIRRHCVCQYGYRKVKDSCLQRKAVGEPCSEDDQCLNNALCSNVCECEPGLLDVGSRCVRVPYELKRPDIVNVTLSSFVFQLETPDSDLWDFMRITQHELLEGPPKQFCLVKAFKYEFCDEELSECNSNETVHIEQNNSITYNVTALTPGEQYNVTFQTLTCTHNASVKSKPVTVPVAVAPGPVVNLTGNTSKGRICATWEAPLSLYKNYAYFTTLTDNVKNKQLRTFETPHLEHCFDENLLGFWEYSIRVKASSGTGKEGQATSTLVITDKKDPGHLSLEVETAEGSCHPRPSRTIRRRTPLSYRKMRLQWTPHRPEDRGRRIRLYKVSSLPKEDNQNPVYINLDKDITDANDTIYRRSPMLRRVEQVFTVTPGQSYTFQLKTVDVDGKDFTSSTSDCIAPVGDPPVWNQMYQPTITKRGTRTIHLLFRQTSFFLNDSNGDILSRGLIVSTEEVSVPSDLDMESKWKDCNKEPKLTYRIELQDLQTNKPFIVGSDEPCPTNGYCNGFLCPEMYYHFLPFVCNKKKCNYGLPLTVRTAKVQESANMGYIAWIVVAVLMIICAGIVIWAYQKYSKSSVASVTGQEAVNLTKIKRKRSIVLGYMERAVDKLNSDSKRLFAAEYEDIIKLSPRHKTDEANRDENKQKNRWVNVLPFDHSRVKLDIIDGDETSDYINASFLPGYNGEREYIASQGPLPGTVDDFWRMVWEYDAPIIVMVTPLKEKTKTIVQTKCEQYWPDVVREPKQYGDLVVENTSFSSLDKYNVTIFEVRKEGKEEVKTVRHFHFLDWKDMSANVQHSDMLNFVRVVRSYVRPSMTGPIIVHCSAGVGRTGTFICLDYLMQFIDNHDLGESVDIFQFVLKLRNGRVLMVQTETQYVFIHECASDMVIKKKTVTASDENLSVNHESFQQEVEESGVADNENVATSNDPLLVTETTQL